MNLLKRTLNVLFSLSVILTFASCSDSRSSSGETPSTVTTELSASTTQSSGAITTGTTLYSESSTTTSSTATPTTNTAVSSETVTTTTTTTTIEPVSSSAATEERISVGGVSFTKPANFNKSEANGVITMMPSNTDATDNIVVNTGADKISLYAVDSLESMLNNALSAYNISVSNLTLKKDKLHICDCLEGHDYAEITYDMVYSGEVSMSAKQIVLFVNDKSIHFTYTYLSNTYDSVFQDLIDSISID